MTTSMRPFGSTISLAEARAIIERAIEPMTRVERVALPTRSGRVLAEIVVVDRRRPAVRARGHGRLRRSGAGHLRREPRHTGAARCIEQVFTGQIAVAGRSAPAQCIEIATGAPMPARRRRRGDGRGNRTATGRSTSGCSRRSTPRRTSAGRVPTFSKGQTVLQPGDAAQRQPRRRRWRRWDSPTWTVFASRASRSCRPATRSSSRDSRWRRDRSTTSTASRSPPSSTDNGGVAVPYRTAADTIEDLSRAVDECLEQDVLVFSGGSSVGERDLILDVIARKGEVLFHGIAVKPGKPTAFGRIGGKLVLRDAGLSRPPACRTPTSCSPRRLRRIARLPEQIVRSRHAAARRARVASVPGRHQFYTVRIENGLAMPAFKASGDITSMSKADGYIEIPADVDLVDEGTPVEVKLF